jgi:hypothetical protein
LRKKHGDIAEVRKSLRTCLSRNLDHPSHKPAADSSAKSNVPSVDVVMKKAMRNDVYYSCIAVSFWLRGIVPQEQKDNFTFC